MSFSFIERPVRKTTGMIFSEHKVKITSNWRRSNKDVFGIILATCFTLMSLVWTSPSEATSWCVSTYLSHFDRAFSLGADTWMELGMTGCKTVPKSRLEVGLWSTHFSAPAERDRRCSGRTGVVVCSGWCEDERIRIQTVKTHILCK